VQAGYLRGHVRAGRVALRQTEKTHMKDREETIAFDMNYCQHYTPDTIYGMGGKKATGICGAGVCVKDVRVPKSSHPCIGGHELPDATTVCPKWIRQTREHAEARADAFEEAIRRMTVVGPVVAEWRKKPPRGKAEVIECPVCKGRLHLSQAACNGHVHGHCETADCVSWME